MICITVAPTSRTLAKVDILNAMRYADVVELALDHLVKEPDIKDLIEGWDKPIIVSCRRKQDGGQWDGSETDRMTLLRQAIVSIRSELAAPDEAGSDYADIRQRLSWILTALRHHRARESDLIYEAYYDAFHTDLSTEQTSDAP